MNYVTKENWTEEEVSQLPIGEHNYFDRKGGRLFEAADRNELLNTIAKAISAFANSGGGHLVLGVRDDGTFDGVPTIISGTTTTREWLEQKIPHLLDYPLVDFRVHKVLPSTTTSIPADRILIVIDVGDSAFAPHQTTRQNQYYYRSGGHSLPAPHFYLEALRQRLANPALNFELEDVIPDTAWEHEGHIIVRIDARVRIINIGRVAAYKWALVVRAFSQNEEGRADDYFFGGIPGSSGRMSSIRIDDTILPGCDLLEKRTFGVRLRPAKRTEQAIRDDLNRLLESLVVHMQVATETSAGETKQLLVGANTPIDQALEKIRAQQLINA